MNERIKEIRKAVGLSQAAFGAKLGVSRDVINNVENGRVDATEILIKSICHEFGVDEIWLRTGAGEMFRQRSRSEELAEYINSALSDRPDSFRASLISTLLKYDPNGPEWEMLERIYNDIAKMYKKDTEEE